jgi:diacylglycerol kinase (ATP)
MKATDKGIKRILKAFTYSLDGFTATFATEAAFRQDLLFCVALEVVCLLLPASGLEKVLLSMALLGIVIAELVNTAVEVVIDRISEDYHPLSKKAKDIGSLVVLLSFVNFGMLFVFVLWALI